MSETGFDYDVIVIGSGFGGSVAALRATEKGYTVAVLEAGKRWPDDEIPKTSWDVRKFLWQPELELFGMQRMEAFGTTSWCCAVRCWRRRRIARLRQHALRAAEEVLRRA